MNLGGAWTRNNAFMMLTARRKLPDPAGVIENPFVQKLNCNETGLHDWIFQFKPPLYENLIIFRMYVCVCVHLL